MVYTDIYNSKAENMATDFILSKNTYLLDRVVEKPGGRAFVCKELMHIPKDKQVSPE